MISEVIALGQAVSRHPERGLKAPADFGLLQHEQIAIVGTNGSGKTILTDMIMGELPLQQGTLAYDFGDGPTTALLGRMARIAFTDVLGTAESPYYLQQRFNVADAECSPELRQTLPEAAWREERLMTLFGIGDMLSKRIVQLSSGEMRRYDLFKALLSHPRVLVVEDPFIGLDRMMRDQLHELFRKLIREGQTQLILVMASDNDIPSYVTHVVAMRQLRVQPKMSYDAFVTGRPENPATGLSEEEVQSIRCLPAGSPVSLRQDGVVGDEVISIRNLSVTIGGRTLFNGLNWTVRRGEQWALLGPNGAGKSMLLSLICADNPMAYAVDVAIYGRWRGTGESIWDVKRPIGFVSPELHRAYHEDLPAAGIVASGLYDSVGLYRKPSAEQQQICAFWMHLFGIGHLAERSFLKLSGGEQRLVLLARAFVKDPHLLILDEPFHGLDPYHRERVRQIITVFCSRPDRTMIMVTHFPEHLPPGVHHTLTLNRPSY